jgi:outer membrane autotransporter protein
MHSGSFHFSCRIVRASLNFSAFLLALAIVVAPRSVLAATPDAESLLLTGTALDMASMQNDSVMQRTAALRSGVQGVDLAGLNVQAGERRIGGASLNAVSRPLLSPVLDSVLNRGDNNPWGAFANGDVHRNGSTALGGDNIGMTTGIDYRFGNHLAVGSSLGYASFGVGADPGRSFLDVESKRLSLFGTYYRQNAMHLDGLIAYGSTAYDSARRLDADSPVGSAIGPAIAKASASGSQLSGALTSALDLQHGAWRFGPKLGAYFLDVDVDRLNEYGAGAQDLSIGNQNAQSTRLTAGAYLSVALPVPFGVLTPNINADYVRDSVRSAAVDGQFRTDPSTRLTLMPDALPAPLDPGYFVWSVGAKAQFAKALSGFVTYRTLATADSVTSNELTWGMRFETKLH